MFAMINPQLSTDKGDQMGTMISKMAKSNPKIKVMVDQTAQVTLENSFATKWGDSFAVSSYQRTSSPR